MLKLFRMYGLEIGLAVSFVFFHRPVVLFTRCRIERKLPGRAGLPVLCMQHHCGCCTDFRVCVYIYIDMYVCMYVYVCMVPPTVPTSFGVLWIVAQANKVRG